MDDPSLYLDDKNNPWVVLAVNLLGKTSVKCLIDTGFSGGLALPVFYSSLVEKKVSLFSEKFQFANGDENWFPIYSTRVKYLKSSIELKLMFIDNTVPLVGLSFLKFFDFDLNIAEKQISLKKT